MKTKLQKFQDDLQKGMTIEEACRKHGMSLQEAFTKMPRTLGKKPSTSTGEKYITKHGGNYLVRKYIKGHYRSFGNYKSLQEAILVRDYCVQHGWEQDQLDEYCQILNVERCKRK